MSDIPVTPASRVELSPNSQIEFDLMDAVGALIAKKYKVNPGPKFIQQLYDELWVLLFAKMLTGTGGFRLPNGLGSFRLSRLRPGWKQNPGSTEWVQTEPRVALKYIEGDAVRVALGRKPLGRKRKKQQPRLLTLLQGELSRQARGRTEEP